MSQSQQHVQSYEELTRPLRERAAQRQNPERQAQLQALFSELERSVLPGAVAVGAQAPDFDLRNAATGEPVRLSEARQRGPIVLSFYRGQWCPYCNLEVRALESIHEAVRATGGEIYLIGPETQENALKLREKTGASIPLLFDDDAAVCRSFGLSFELPEYFQQAYTSNGNDLALANPDAGWTLPVPATYVIARSGEVVARHLDPDYTQRMEPSEILAAVQAAAQR